MLPPRLQTGDTIGLCSPSHLATEESYRPIIEALQSMGFSVQCAQNLFTHDWGYAASPENRAADVNELIRDDAVKLILFGGGEGADDLLPLIDYEAARRSPKLWLSYSDGTSILNTVHSQTGLITCYGQMPGLMPKWDDYDRSQFKAHIMGLADAHAAAEPWHSLTQGVAEGTLVGGYLDNVLFLIATGRIPSDRPYVLFLEDHEQFFGVEHESVLLGRLEQSGLLPFVKGVLFGHYSAPVNEQLLQRLRRLGETWQIPVAYCDDFGHGTHHAILPIGAQARLDTAACTLSYRYE